METSIGPSFIVTFLSFYLVSLGPVQKETHLGLLGVVEEVKGDCYVGMGREESGSDPVEGAAADMIGNAEDAMVPFEEICGLLVKSVEFIVKELPEHEHKMWLLLLTEVLPIYESSDGAIIVVIANVGGECEWI